VGLAEDVRAWDPPPKFLDQRQVAFKLPVLADARFSMTRDEALRMLLYRVETFVLSDQGGKPVTAKEVVERKVRPRWLPKWLWRSIFVERVVVSVTAYPLWTYPSADITVPELGRPVRIYEHSSSNYAWDGPPMPGLDDA